MRLLLIALTALLLAPIASASDVIRLGRDVMPNAAPASQPPTYRIEQRQTSYGTRQTVRLPRQQPTQEAVYQRQQPVQQRQRHQGQPAKRQPNAIERSAYNITRSAINTTSYEIKRGVTNAIRDGFDKLDF